MAPGKISKLRDIPFLDLDQLARPGVMFSLTFHVDGAWRLWVRANDQDDFIEISGWPAESYYWSAVPAKEGDFTTPFLTFIANHANRPGLSRSFAGFREDLFNLSADLGALDIVHANGGEAAVRMATPIIEHFSVTCRSLFDLLQDMLRCLWSDITLLDPKLRKRALERSFAGMVLKGKRLKSADEIADHYGLPLPIAQCYAHYAPLFLKMRDFRDGLVHHGHHVDHIFKGEKTFLVTPTFGGFDKLKVWREDEVEPNELAPLKPVLGLMALAVVRASNDFVTAFSETIQFPPAVVPGMNFYCRGYINTGFLEVVKDAGDRVAQGLSLLGPETPGASEPPSPPEP